MKNTTSNSDLNLTQNPQNSSDNFTGVEEQWRALARIDYAFYCEYVHHGIYIPSQHHQLICDKLQALEAGEIDRLMIFMPPRHGKSMTVTETFPSYFIGKHPDRRVIEVSYGDSLAQKFGKLNRRKIQEFGEGIFGINISDEKASMTDWDIEGHRGGMLSVGIGGGITGQGADLLIIDDPIKNREQADSETYREKLWSEWQDTLLTRLHDGGKVIIILTRWHEDDLAGRILNQEADRWEVLSLPAIAEDEDDPLGRLIGQPLWPEGGFDMKWAVRRKQEVGSRTWTALYQQRPSSSEGELFKRDWWKFYTNIPSDFDQVIQSWDCTFKDSSTSDYVVGQVWGKKGADNYLLDQIRARMNLPTTLNAIRSLTAKWPQANAKLIEDKANGPAVIQMLQKEIAGLIPVNPEGGKSVRANAVTPFIESGNVYLPDPTIAPWVHDFIEECSAFPNGKNDDMVDSMSQALTRLSVRVQHKPIYGIANSMTYDEFFDAANDNTYFDDFMSRYN